MLMGKADSNFYISCVVLNCPQEEVGVSKVFYFS